jgi:hypothetical protein
MSLESRLSKLEETLAPPAGCPECSGPGVLVRYDLVADDFTWQAWARGTAVPELPPLPTPEKCPACGRPYDPGKVFLFLPDDGRN